MLSTDELAAAFSIVMIAIQPASNGARICLLLRRDAGRDVDDNHDDELLLESEELDSESLLELPAWSRIDILTCKHLCSVA